MRSFCVRHGVSESYYPTSLKSTQVTLSSRYLLFPRLVLLFVSLLCYHERKFSVFSRWRCQHWLETRSGLDSDICECRYRGRASMFHMSEVLAERMGWLPGGVCIAPSSYRHYHRLCSRRLWLGPTYILPRIQWGSAPAILQPSCASLLCRGIELCQDGHCCIVYASDSWLRGPHTPSRAMDSRYLGLYCQHYGYHRLLYCLHSNREIMKPFN